MVADGGEFDPAAEGGRALGRGLLEENMGPGSSLAHLYRGERHRMTRWRERMDRTTNWAVTVLAAVLTWSFSAASRPHFLILTGAVAVGLFLGVEAHRFRGFVVWRTRVRMMQENVWAQGLDPTEGLLHEDWRAELARDYREPTVKIGYEEALAHRLRRIYLPLSSVILLAWLVRTTVGSAAPWPGSAAIGPVPGALVAGVVLALYAVAVVVTVRPREWKGHPELRSLDVGRWKED